MKQFFIIGYKKRYSIREDGNVIRHYRFLNNGKKDIGDYIVKKYIGQNEDSCMVSLSKYPNGSKGFHMNQLMVKYFRLQPPDNFHLYKVIHIDGDPLNVAVNNLKFTIRTRTKYKFYPQSYYDKKGNIISKKCGECGEVKEIKCFNFQKAKRPHENRTYRNRCESCRSSIRWDQIKNDEILSKINKQTAKKSREQEHCKIRVRKWAKINRDNLGNSYVNSLIKRAGMNPELFTTEMKEIVKLKTLIKREIKQN